MLIQDFQVVLVLMQRVDWSPMEGLETHLKEKQVSNESANERIVNCSQSFFQLNWFPKQSGMEFTVTERNCRGRIRSCRIQKKKFLEVMAREKGEPMRKGCWPNMKILVIHEIWYGVGEVGRV